LNIAALILFKMLYPFLQILLFISRQLFVLIKLINNLILNQFSFGSLPLLSQELHVAKFTINQFWINIIYKF